jgi:hypothetical protein
MTADRGKGADRRSVRPGSGRQVAAPASVRVYRVLSTALCAALCAALAAALPTGLFAVLLVAPRKHRMKTGQWQFRRVFTRGSHPGRIRDYYPAGIGLPSFNAPFTRPARSFS